MPHRPLTFESSTKTDTIGDLMRSAATFALLALAGSVLAQGVSAPQPIRIKAVLQTRTTTYLHAPSGLLLPRRASLEPFMVEEIKAAFTEALSQLESATGGKYKVQLYLGEDSEHACGIYGLDQIAAGFGEAGLGRWGGISAPQPQQGGASPSLFSGLVQDSLVSLINSDPFDAIDGSYHGPYDAAFLVHPGLDGPTTMQIANGMPVWSLGWNNLPRTKPKEALKAALSARLATLSPDFASLKPADYTTGLGSAGEAEESAKDGVVTVKSTGVVPRGGYTLAIIGADSAGSLRFSVRTASQEPLAIVVYDKQGRTEQTIMLKGFVPGMSASVKALKTRAGAPVQVGPDWTEISIAFKDLSAEPGASIMLGSPGFPLERGQLEQTSFEFKNPAMGDAAETMQVVAAEPSEQEKELVAWKESLASGWDDGKIARMVENLSSSLAWVRASSMQAALDHPDPRLIGPLRAVAGSAAIGDSFLACRALGGAGAEGQAALADVLKKGPFETNRRFAAEFLKKPLDRATLNMVSVLLVNRGWRTRLAAARILADNPSRESQVALAGTLDFRSEPHPAVRLVIAEACDVNFELSARRLLYAAVNDPNQWVRASALVRLLDCENAEIRAEAIKGVTDDSPTVRVRLLQAMTAKPSPDFRSSLRQAVTDRNSQVRAAALYAFAAQPEPAAQGEIENTLKDDDQGVQLALVHLARSGKFRLPSPVIESLKKSPHEDVRKAAETLPAG